MVREQARVLIVDDDRGACETIADVLRLKGHDVHTATEGRAGLRALATERFDVAIVDIQLPDIPGLEVLEAIKRASPATEVIFVTAFASVATAVQAINGAAFAYLVRPFEMDFLLATVKKALERQALTRAYRLVTEHILDAVFLLNTEGCFVFGNRRLEELTGYGLDELLGRPTSIVLTPEGARAREARMEAIQRGDAVPSFFDTELLRKDGTKLWVEVNTTSVVEDGRMVARIGAARDITVRKEAERRRAAESAVGTVLAEAATVSAAAVAVLHAIGEALGWDVGAVWMVDPECGLLRCLDVWHADASGAPAFEAATRQVTFERGMDLPGRVWSGAAPLWIADIATERNVLRGATASTDNLHAFLGFPLSLGHDVIGVVELFSRDIRPPNHVILDWVMSVGRQIAQFSERKHAEDQLRRTNATLEALIQSSPITVISLDLHGRVMRWNKAAERLFGWTEAEIMGRHLLMVPEDQEEEARRTLALWRKGVVTTDVEVVRRTRDGSLIPMSRSGGALRDGQGEVIGTIANLVDIRDRKRSEAALRESEERFRAMFEQAAVGIAEVTTGGRWLRVNQRLCDILGYTRDELLERTFQDITHPDDLVAELARVQQLLAGEIQTLSAEKRYLHKDGSTIWVEVTVSLVRDPGGEPRYSIAVVQDITGRRQLEEEYHHAQRMEGVGRLAGGIAHDFNNLLTIINGRCALIIASLPPSDPLQRHVGLIEKTVVRATALTRQLLAFSRKQVLQPKVVAINELVSRSMELLTRLIGEDIDLAFVPAPEAGRVHVDRGQLEQVIVNLVVNARDAMPDGGRLTIETANTALDAGYASHHVDVTPGRYVMLVVSDTGTGMSAEVQARIFEPFFTTKEPGKGTGLGLATVYGIVKQSGGHVRVYSEPGTGTTFKIYLPRTDAATQEERAPAVGAAPHGTETVLLVEDEADVRSLAREILEGFGYAVLEAGSPTEAIVIAERHAGTIDLLLTDVIMPRMSGRALAAAIAVSRPETRILFISGYADDAIIRHGVLEPGMHFLEKPFTPHTLAVKVRAVLDALD